MNKIILIGNLTRDPEMRATSNGVTVCSFTIAVNRRFAQQGGERVTDFFRINAWRQMGESCGKYLAKGRKVAVTGELQPRSYVDRNGETRFALDVNASEVEFLTPRGSGGQATDGGAAGDPDAYGFADLTTDDIPFGD